MTSGPKAGAEPHPRPRSSIAATGLLVLGIAVVLYFARSILIPITLALVLSLLLSPIMRAMTRLKLPRPIAAGILVLGFLLTVVVLIGALAQPAENWLEEAPQTLRELRSDLYAARGQLDGIEDVAKEVDNLAAVDDEAGVPAQEVVVKEPGLIASMLGGLTTALTALAVVMFTTYFLLACGRDLIRAVAAFGDTWSERRKILVSARDVQQQLGRYLGIVTIINISLGLLVGMLGYVLGINNPALWGAMVALFNFAPYAGAVVSFVVLSIVSLSTFDGLGQAAIFPLSFLVLTAVEGQLITPSILGYRMSINPLFVFLAVVLWGWLWGIVGALLAVPLLVSFIALAENVPQLHATVKFLRGGTSGDRCAFPGEEIDDDGVSWKGDNPTSPVHDDDRLKHEQTKLAR